MFPLKIFEFAALIHGLSPAALIMFEDYAEYAFILLIKRCLGRLSAFQHQVVHKRKTKQRHLC
jgi:hypothetical protein